jgi:acetyl-CoA C-acetyltransferase
MTTNDPIVIVSALRTPIGNFQGCFKGMTAPELGAVVIKAIQQQTALSPHFIDEVLMGCVLPAGVGQAPARQAALLGGLPASTDCTTINKVCGSGMKAVMLAHDLLMVGSQKVILAGGMESMSNAPYLLRARQGYRLGHQALIDHMLHDGLEDAYQKGVVMGSFAEDCVQSYHFTRQHQDEFALVSLNRARNACENGGFAAELVPISLKISDGEKIAAEDEGPLTARPEKISQLKPAFKKDGTITAANAASISDGAAALLLMRRSEAEKQGLTPLATIMGFNTHSQDPALFTTAPVGAIQKLLDSVQWSAKEVDLFEINEAFAVVAMVAMQELKLSHEKVNVHGGACVLGHPIGASGARILITLIHALRQYGLKRGVAALCIGGGEATAMAVEMEHY